MRPVCLQQGGAGLWYWWRCAGGGQAGEAKDAGLAAKGRGMPRCRAQAIPAASCTHMLQLRASQLQHCSLPAGLPPPRSAGLTICCARLLTTPAWHSRTSRPVLPLLASQLQPASSPHSFISRIMPFSTPPENKRYCNPCNLLPPTTPCMPPANPPLPPACCAAGNQRVEPALLPSRPR